MCLHPAVPLTPIRLRVWGAQSLVALPSPLHLLLPCCCRYEALVDSTIPKFMYGHHYSTAVGTVIHYLLRLYPFTDLHVKYQVGHARCSSGKALGGGGTDW